MTFVPNIRDRLKGHLAKIWAKMGSTWSRWKRYLNPWNGNKYFAVYIYIYIFFFFICVHQMLAREIRRMHWKTWTHFLFSFLFDKDVNKFLFFFFYNLSPESKGGLNYFFSFSPYRERVGFITLIYFTFLSSPRQQTVSSASSRGCMFHARVISDLRSAPSKVSHDIDWDEGIYP